MSKLGWGRIVVKESRAHFIPDLLDFGKKKKSSRGAKSGQCDWGINGFGYNLLILSLVKLETLERLMWSILPFCIIG